MYTHTGGRYHTSPLNSAGEKECNRTAAWHSDMAFNIWFLKERLV